MLPLTLILLVAITSFSATVSSAEGYPIAGGTDKALNQPKSKINDIKPELANLQERMRTHNIQGVSIAFMENRNITWTLSEGKIDDLSPREVDEKTLFQTMIISKPAYEALVSELNLKHAVALDKSVNAQTLLNSKPVPPVSSSKTTRLNLLSASSQKSGIQLKDKKISDHDGILSIVNVLEPKELIKNKTNNKAISIDKPVNSQTANNNITKNVASLTQDVLGSPISSATEGLWVTPSELLMLAAAIEKDEQGRIPSSTSNKLQLQIQIQSLDIKPARLEAEEEGMLMSLSDNALEDGFSTHLFIHSKTGDGIAIMTNSDKGDELIKDLMPSINDIYGWTKKDDSLELAALADGSLPETMVDKSTLEKPPEIAEEPINKVKPRSAVVLVAEGEQY